MLSVITDDRIAVGGVYSFYSVAPYGRATSILWQWYLFKTAFFVGKIVLSLCVLLW
ncbi:hypothetical protein [Escherichia phage UPEC06]|nr:hypothetical protein [Escherichia phage UPEC06]